jgi:hypothetical protein
MRNSEFNSILLVNLYFTGCKLQKPSCPITEMVRKYLSKRINKALIERNSTSRTSLTSKAFIVLGFLAMLINY